MTDRPNSAPPVVQAEMLSDDHGLALHRAAERQYKRQRTERRRRAFNVFYTHAPGSLDEKTAAVHALIHDSPDGREVRSLLDLLGKLRSLYAACPPSPEQA
jgi:hypothetical protein